ncbi:hypothetical protein HanPI659440_Chr13g0509311 [Helianthus annuus]|nr:hypothetical protein HanPI659440_Chr13g0509311 [Helianthus annuus]
MASSSSDSGVFDTIDPMAMTSDDEIATDLEVYTSDATSTDEDDFQPFALPVFGDDLPLADGPPGVDLPLVPIPAPLPFAAVPFEEQPLDALSYDDIDLLIVGPPKGDQDGGAPMEDDVPLADVPIVDPVVPMIEIPAVDALVVPPFEAPVMEALPKPSISYPLESASSATIHVQDVQHYSTDTDSDMAISAASVVFHDFDPESEVEFLPAEPAPADPELGVAPEPVFAPDPIPVDAPVITPPAAEIEDDDDYPPFVLPVTPPAAPVSAPVDVPLFHPHVSDTHRTDLPTTFLQDIPHPRPGEGPSTGPHGHMPHMTAAFPYIPPFAPTAHTAFTSSAPTGEPFIWSLPNVMPLSDPYHPFHVGYTADDILISLQLQQDALSRQVQDVTPLFFHVSPVGPMGSIVT